MSIKLKAATGGNPESALAVPSRRVDTLDTPALDPGDTVEFSTSYNIKFPDRSEMWVKFGANTRVRESEDAGDAADRLAAYVINQMTARVQQAVAHNQSLVIDL